MGTSYWCICPREWLNLRKSQIPIRSKGYRFSYHTVQATQTIHDVHFSVSRFLFQTIQHVMLDSTPSRERNLESLLCCHSVCTLHVPSSRRRSASALTVRCGNVESIASYRSLSGVRAAQEPTSQFFSLAFSSCKYETAKRNGTRQGKQIQLTIFSG